MPEKGDKRNKYSSSDAMNNRDSPLSHPPLGAGLQDNKDPYDYTAPEPPVFPMSLVNRPDLASRSGFSPDMIVHMPDEELQESTLPARKPVSQVPPTRVRPVSPIGEFEAARSPGATSPVSATLRQKQPPEQVLQPMPHFEPSIRLSVGIKILMVLSFIVLLIPNIVTIIAVADTYTLYSQARSGMTHIQNIESMFSGSAKGDLTKVFQVSSLQQTQTQIEAAHADFQQLATEVDQDRVVGATSVLAPQQIQSLRSLIQIGIDGTAIGDHIMPTVISLSPQIVSALKSSSNTAKSNNSASDIKYVTPSAIITPTTYNQILSDLKYARPLLQDMSAQSKLVSLNMLPLNQKEQAALTTMLPLLPVVDNDLNQFMGITDQVRWMLGVDHPTSFLVQPMDSSELRSTGGFTGQFGELIINGAHVSSLNLKNIGVYEEDHTNEGSPPYYPVYDKVQNQQAPSPYSWWPIGNFGLRDSNISADFPIAAKLAMDRYNYEFGRTVDGVVSFTPLLIANILTITGPIKVPKYGETITPANLVDRLHYYQLDNTGIRKEELVEHVDDPEQARKLFSQSLTSLIISSVTHLPVNKMFDVVNVLFQSMKTKDLEVYSANPQVESLIAKYGSTASIDRSTTHDGFFFVQSNDTASKASQYVTTSIQDNIAINASGTTATHTMVVTLNYQEKGPVNGPDTYRDYVRAYVPSGSTFISGDGFAQYDTPYCAANSAYANYVPCSTDVYGDGSLVCSVAPNGDWATWLLDDPYKGLYQPLDHIGSPTNMTSDETGRAMYGGWVVIPQDCVMKVQLSWSVPLNKSQSYSYLIQRQSSVFPQVNLTIQPAPGTCSSEDVNYSGTMNGEDTVFTLNTQGSHCSITTTPFTN